MILAAATPMEPTTTSPQSPASQIAFAGRREFDLGVA
jgi:hypothetical protein